VGATDWGGMTSSKQRKEKRRRGGGASWQKRARRSTVGRVRAKETLHEELISDKGTSNTPLRKYRTSKGKSTFVVQLRTGWDWPPLELAVGLVSRGVRRNSSVRGEEGANL